MYVLPAVAMGVAALALHRAVRRGGLRSVGRQSVGSVSSAEGAVRVLRSIEAKCTDDLVEEVVRGLREEGAGQEQLRLWTDLFEALDDQIGAEAYALTILTSCLTLVIRERQALDSEGGGGAMVVATRAQYQ